MNAAICSRVTNAEEKDLPPPQPVVTPLSTRASMSVW